MDTYLTEVDAADELSCAKSCENEEGYVFSDCNFTQRFNFFGHFFAMLGCFEV